MIQLATVAKIRFYKNYTTKMISLSLLTVKTAHTTIQFERYNLLRSIFDNLLINLKLLFKSSYTFILPTIFYFYF